MIMTLYTQKNIHTRWALYGAVALAFLLVVTRPLSSYAAQEFANDDVVIQADAISHIPEKELILAVGNVEIVQGERVLMAEELTYDQKTDIVTASGGVSLLEPDGNVYFAENVQLTDDMREGVIAEFRAQFVDESRLAANTATRVNENVIELEQAVFSGCKICKDGKPVEPLWQVKADKVRLDEEEQRVYYRDAFFEIFGVPVVYTPYLSHPTPDADSKSGFLRPTYSSISTLGPTVKIPYYVSIAPNMDATITPFFTAEEGAVMIADFRHLTENGYYQLEGSITNPDERDAFGERVGGREIRGHIEGYGNFTIDDEWSWGFSGKRATDDTYLQRYKFGNEDLLTSTAYLERIAGRDFVSMETFSFQGLNVDDDPDTIPLVLPLIQTHTEWEPGWMGSRWSLDTNALHLTRGEGAESRRLSATAAWTLPYITQGGHVFEFKTSLRADGYHVDGVADPLDPDNDEEGATGRFVPELQANWSYPVVNYYENAHVSLEPVTNFIISPRGNNPSKIPNEDSQELEISDVNLFSNNRFTGLDRVEGGPRVNYGVRGGFFHESGTSVNMLVGQNYRAKKDENFSALSGLDDNFSDYVGRLTLSDNELSDVTYRFRMDKDNLEMRRSEVELALNFTPVHLSASYVLLDEETSDPEDDKEEILASAAYQVTPSWGISAYTRRDLTDDGGFISAGSGLRYDDECIFFAALLNREFTRDRDIEPSTSLTFEVGFKQFN